MSTVNISSQSSQIGGSVGVKSPVTTEVNDDETKSRIGDEYVLVRKDRINEKGLSKPTLVNYRSLLQQQRVPDTKAAPVGALIKDSKDSESDVKTSVPFKLKRALGSAIGGARSGKLRTTRVMLVQVLAVGNTASNINATVASIDPINSTDFADIAALFDEVRVRRFRFHHSPCVYNTVSSTTGGNHGGSIGVDFTRLTAAASFADNADEDLNYLYDTAVFTTSIGLTKLNRNVESGWIKPPSIAINPLPSATQYQFVGDNWALTSGTTTALCANLKFYELNSQSSGATVGKCTIWMDCEFRSRD